LERPEHLNPKRWFTSYSPRRF